MSHAYSRGTGSQREKILWIALALTGGFTLAEVAGGVLTGSLALISDAAHMVTDSMALGVALAAIRIGRRRADARRSYGYARVEILAAAFNALLLFAVGGYILYEGVQRFFRPPEVQSTPMLVIAALGLAVNLVSMRLLAAGSGESLNMKGAYLETWSDMLGSLGVIVAALVIKFTGWAPIDPLIAVAIGLWVLPRTWILLRQSLNILLEGVPEGVDVAAIERGMRGVAGVRGVHDLHVWALTQDRPVLSAHVVLEEGVAIPDQVLAALRGLLREQYAIAHATLQLEAAECGSDADACRSGEGGDGRRHEV